MAIVQVYTQLRKNGTEMFLFGDDNMVERVLYPSHELTDGSNLKEGNPPSYITVLESESLKSDQIIQCVNCQKYITKTSSIGNNDNESCKDGCTD